MARKRKATLHYRDGRSDKIYRVEIAPQDGRHVVTIAYGRRGTSLKTGIKTPRPVELDEAWQVFDKIVQGKKAKGYVEGEPASLPASAARRTAARRTGASTQSRGALPNEIAQALRSFQSKIDDLLSNTQLSEPSISLLGEVYIDRAPAMRLDWHRIVDPAFGILTYSARDWITDREVNGLGRIRVVVDPPVHHDRSGNRSAPLPPGPTERQRRAFRSFLADAPRWRQVIEAANWDYYVKWVHEEDEEDTPGSALGAKTPPKLWSLLRNPSVRIPWQHRSSWWIQFNWECAWDPEHGHAVVLRNGKPYFVGQQGGVDI